jgi:UDP-N-acetylglucosamine:LPS N-acetylglucosamine transferase
MNASATPTPLPRRLRVLAVASGGGHWVQLRRLRPAWEGMDVTYVTTVPGYRDEVLRDATGDSPGNASVGFRLVPDANRWQKLRLVKQLLAIALVVLQVRPDAVVTTGAAPGYFALRLGKLLGARTVWVDSMANAEELSLSGQQAGHHAGVWLTQWPHLAKPGGPQYRGAVL